MFVLVLDVQLLFVVWFCFFVVVIVMLGFIVVLLLTGCFCLRCLIFASLLFRGLSREAPVRFGYGLGGGTVRAVPIFGSFAKRAFLCQHSLIGKDGSGFVSWKTAPAVPLSVSGKTVPTDLDPEVLQSGTGVIF